MIGVRGVRGHKVEHLFGGGHLEGRPLEVHTY